MRALEARKIPIAEYLAREGVTPRAVRKGGRELWYQSPIRSGDTSPSFKVDTAKNLWFDHGAGRGGNVIDLVCDLRRVTVAEALAVLSDIGGVAASQTRLVDPAVAGENKKQEGFTVIAVRDIEHPALVQYLDKRRIPLALARQHLKEVRFRPAGAGSRYFGLGFPCGAGYDVRSAVFKGFVGHSKDITIIEGPDAETLSVFEGVMDYLSYLAYRGLDSLPHAVLILHSTALVPRAIAAIVARPFRTIRLFLDHDAAGRAASEQMARAFGTGVIDEASLYAGAKDVNEWRMITGGKQDDARPG